MTILEKNYPPYQGNESYLHLCFAEASGKKVLALLRCLRQRGIRVWYGTEVAADRGMREAMNVRMLGASLTAVYLDEEFRNDPAAKSRLLACQREGQHIVCLNTDDGDSGLSIGLHADAAEIRLGRKASAEDMERALLHAEGFSQELIGEPEKQKDSRLKILTIVIAAAAAVLLVTGGLWFLRHKADTPLEEIPVPTPADTVTIEDETVREAIRNAIGGGFLTEESLQSVTLLHLEGNTLPDDLSALSLLPSLETVEISQSAAVNVAEHPELSDYTVELYGGASE